MSYQSHMTSDAKQIKHWIIPLFITSPYFHLWPPPWLSQPSSTRLHVTWALNSQVLIYLFLPCLQPHKLVITPISLRKFTLLVLRNFQFSAEGEQKAQSTCRSSVKHCILHNCKPLTDSMNHVAWWRPRRHLLGQTTRSTREWCAPPMFSAPSGLKICP